MCIHKYKEHNPKVLRVGFSSLLVLRLLVLLASCAFFLEWGEGGGVGPGLVAGGVALPWEGGDFEGEFS